MESFDPTTKIKKQLNFDDKKIIKTTTQDVTDLINKNQRLVTADDGFTPSRDMKRAATIPVALYWELKREGIIDDPVAMKKWLNDGDNRKWRTSEGRI